MNKNRCVGTYYENWSHHQCSRNGTTVYEGKPYCKTHNPDIVKQKDEARSAKWKKESEERETRWKLEVKIKRLIPEVLENSKSYVAQSFDSNALHLLDQINECLEYLKNK